MDKMVLRVSCGTVIRHEAVRIIDSSIQFRGMLSPGKIFM